MAQFVMQDLVNKAGLADVLCVDSAATTNDEIGHPPHHGTVDKLKQVGVPVLPHRARKVRADEYDEWDMDLLIQEFNSVKERNFQLEFTYPDKSQRKNMRIIHRDMTQNELRDIRKSNSNLADITSKLANGEIRKEDLDEDTVNRLKDVLYN